MIRPAEYYLYGSGEAAIVLVPARVASKLEAVLSPFRNAQRGIDPEVDNVLVALRVAGRIWTSTYLGTPTALPAEPTPGSNWLGTRSAAKALGITPRAVRKAIEREQLRAEISEGEWRIRRDWLEHYKARRTA